MLAAEQSGFSIVEVVVAALMLTLISGAVATALMSTARYSGDERKRSQANQIAQQDQERLRGLSIKALSGKDELRTVGPYDGTTYSVRSQGQFLSNTGSASCSSSGTGAAAYVLITTTVDWTDNRRPAVIQKSVITPNAGGTLLVSAIDQNSAPLPGVGITIIGKETEDAVTGSEGCAIFGGLTQSGYYVFASKSGFVDPNGNPSPVGGANVLATGTSYGSPEPWQFGQAGSVTANFKTTMAGTTYTGQKAPSLTWRDTQSGMSVSKNVTPATVPSATVATPSPANLFPFNNGTPGTYTGNYSVWAGKCDAAKPPAGNLASATVPPGGTATLNDSPSPRVTLPGMQIKVSYATAGSYVTPDHIQLKDSCNQIWSIPSADIRPTTDPGFANLGALDFPGQPYGTYTVCADYDPAGATPAKTVNATSVANTSFTAANPVSILITSASTSGTCALT